MEEIRIWDAVPGQDFDEDHDIKELHSWFLDFSHSWPPLTPLMSWFWVKICAESQILASSAELSVPRTKGTEKRTRWGAAYNAILVIRDEEEIKKREIKFKEAMRPYIEDFDAWWEPSKASLMKVYEKAKEYDPDKASNSELFQYLFELIEMNRRMWAVHGPGMCIAFNGWVMFEELCKKLFGLDDQSPEFLKLMVGFESKIFQIDKRLWELAQEAASMGLKDLFMITNSKEILANLTQTPNGKDWLKKFHEFLIEDGWRMQRMHVLEEPTWIENPTPVMMIMKAFLSKGGDWELDEIRKRLTKEREEAVSTIIKRVPEERKNEFLKLLRFAQKCGAWSEEHTYYCEMYCHALMRRGFLGIGRRLAQAGTIDRSDDVFFLNPDEIERVMMVPEYHDLRYITNRRRKEWEEWHKMDRPIVLTDRGSLKEALEKDLLPAMDPVPSKVTVGPPPVVRPELNADLYGIFGAPGFAEGTARVIMSSEHLSDIQPGDILIAPATNTSWTPYYALIKGVIINGGGTLAHASCVGREWGIPVIANTFEGTKKIKTGQRLRVDGNQQVVYILDKEL